MKEEKRVSVVSLVEIDSLSPEQHRWIDLMLGYVKPKTKDEKEMMKEIREMAKKGYIPYIPSEW